MCENFAPSRELDHSMILSHRQLAKHHEQLWTQWHFPSSYLCGIVTAVHDPPRGPVGGFTGCTKQEKRSDKHDCMTNIKNQAFWCGARIDENIAARCRCFPQQYQNMNCFYCFDGYKIKSQCMLQMRLHLHQKGPPLWSLHPATVQVLHELKLLPSFSKRF